MTPLQKLEVRQSERRQRLNELGGLDGLDDDQRTETQGHAAAAYEYGDGERQYRALKIAADAEDAAAEAPPGEPPRTPTGWSCAHAAGSGAFLKARMQNRAVTGAEAELAAEVGYRRDPAWICSSRPPRSGPRWRSAAISGAPATVGVNLDLIRPYVFAPSILPRLGVEMPRVPSGTYATGTITTTARRPLAREPGGASAVRTAAVITVSTATPKRISARLELRAEDIAAIGQDNFESILRQNLSMALSDELDDQGLNGAGATTGTKKDLNGLFTSGEQPRRRRAYHHRQVR